LAIGIGECNALIGGSLEAGAQGSAIAEIALVSQQSNVRSAESHFLDSLRRAVGAAIIYNNDFIFGHQFGQSTVRFLKRLTNAGFLVVGGNNKREGSTDMWAGWTFHGRGLLLEPWRIPQ